MSAELTRVNVAVPTPPVAPGPAMAAPSEVSGPSAASTGASAAGGPSSPSAPAAVALRPPEPAELNFDADEMRQNLQEAIERLNDQMERTRRNLNFRVDETVDRTVVTVRNTSTGEVVRQIPSDSMLKLAHTIEDMKGLFLNTGA